MKSSRFVFMVIMIACVFCGCTNQNINIKHDDPTLGIKKFLNLTDEPKSVVKKSSGVIIYRDTSSPSDTNVRNINFGPKDIEFDLPMKMK